MNREDAIVADRQTVFLAADGSMMCEQHPGFEWEKCPGGAPCPGPGMPWVLETRTGIEEVLSATPAASSSATLTQLIEKWRDAAVFEHEDTGNAQSAQTFDQCANELEAALRERKS